jgi:hypothetical protein
MTRLRRNDLVRVHVSKVNGKVLDQSDGGFHETQPEDVDLGGESA